MSLEVPPDWATLCWRIAEDAIAEVDQFLAPDEIAALAAEARLRDAAGDFRAAGVGRGAARAERADVRGDRTLWLDESAPAPTERCFWWTMAGLRTAVNRTLYLGLAELECHYALYSPGTGYRRHRDQFRDGAGDAGVRVLSCVLYLNERWRAADGGALRVYCDGGVREILPMAGTLVCFLADRFEHEVLPATRERLSIAGWFRRRA